MLKGISPLISPELLKVLCSMGHGDEIVLSDAHFPAASFNTNVLRADGLKVADLLRAILPLFELDSYVPHPLIMMAPVEGDRGRKLHGSRPSNQPPHKKRGPTRALRLL